MTLSQKLQNLEKHFFLMFPFTYFERISPMSLENLKLIANLQQILKSQQEIFI